MCDGALQQSLNVYAGQCRRDHAEIRKSGIASANIRLPREDAPEALLFRQFFQ